jgi:hypothetical protein
MAVWKKAKGWKGWPSKSGDGLGGLVDGELIQYNTINLISERQVWKKKILPIITKDPSFLNFVPVFDR